jgi:beta-carotene hydroxylase
MTKYVEREAWKISKEHSGEVAIPTIGLAISIIFLFLTVLFLFVNEYLSPVFTTLFLTFLTFASYTPIHEAIHGNIGGNNKKFKWLDNVVGYLMAPLLGASFTSHRKEHLTHHSHTNTNKDPDFHIKDLFKSPKHFFKATITVIKTQYTFVMNNYTRAEIVFIIGWRLLFILYTGLISIFVLFFSWFFGLFLLIYLFSYLPHKPYKDSVRWKNTNIRLFPIQRLENLMFQQNLHAIHHLFPRIPFYNYRKVFQKIEPTLREKDSPIINH